MNSAEWMIVAHVAGAASALVLRGKAARLAGVIFAVAGGLFALLAALRILIFGETLSFTFAPSLPVLALSFKLDALGAVFLFLIGLVTVPVALFSLGYTSHHEDRRASVMPGFMLPAFLLSMSLVVMAANVFTFLFFWEMMSLTSYFLVISEYQDEETLSAARWYVGMAHASFALIASALLLAGLETNAMSFSSIHPGSFGPGVKNVIFTLALLGFGAKAGLVPLHVWLPKAHSAAPSHVSALMSGVMVNIGVYGLVRVSIDLLGGGPPWWGGVILVLGAASALVGVLHALMEQDLKRLLAYSTVENMGIIMMGTGLGFIFSSYGLREPLVLALGAALFHALNHATFKSLLFLGAGSVLHATGTRDMERLGGLIRGMPQTAACFLIGSAAISALPPLNGFASEWMIFQSLLLGVRIPHPFMAALMAIAVGALALTGGLAAACFVKAFGITFLALPRSPQAEQARESTWSMRAGMFLLSGLCVLFGLFPTAVTQVLSLAVGEITGLSNGAVGSRFLNDRVRFGLGSAVAVESPSSISPAILALSLALVYIAVLISFRLFRVNRARRLGETWGCGRVVQTARMEYTSAAFAEPLRRVFGALFRPAQDVTIDFHPESKYFVQSIQYRQRIHPWFEEFLYDPLIRVIQRLGNTGRWIQSGSVHAYISYIFVALLLLLLVARWM